MIEFVDSCQIAAFLREPAPQNALKLWDMAFGASPSGFQTHAPGHTQAQGTIEGVEALLVCQAVPPRVDIHISGLPAAGLATPVLSDLDQALAVGIQAIERIVGELAIGRMAVVLEGHAAAESLPKAAQRLKDFVPDLPLPDETVEATYQVVVPRESQAMPGRKLNQLCRWQTVQIQMLAIGVGTPPAPQTRKLAANAHIDVFGVGHLVMDSKAALAELREVVDRAKAILFGGYNELR